MDLLSQTTSATRTELIAAISVLGGVVGLLWKMLVNRNEKTESLLTERWEQCEEGHKKTNSKLLTVTKELGEVQGQVRILSEGVLERIHIEPRTEKKDDGATDNSS